ncbi:hypothetical protein DUI87_07175 [Hirundo rustica rustica]|uniref:Reverse transcriptase domain-containing protein n=1 Tax=Hirundo rustica rustica TaxID=333673 RepID=A0A3M0KPL0_HIRRU|nr:hypothetical protein DUI87_07175 [Hirundo rustica rustica]
MAIRYLASYSERLIALNSQFWSGLCLLVTVGPEALTDDIEPSELEFRDRELSEIPIILEEPVRDLLCHSESLLGKVMEKIMLSMIKQHVQNNQRIKPSQHGFMKGRFCLVFYDKVTYLVDEGEAVDVA